MKDAIKAALQFLGIIAALTLFFVLAAAYTFGRGDEAPQSTIIDEAIVCDKAEQIAELMLLPGDTLRQADIEAVNAEAHNDPACVYLRVGYLPVSKIAEVTDDGDRTFEIW